MHASSDLATAQLALLVFAIVSFCAFSAILLEVVIPAALEVRAKRETPSPSCELTPARRPSSVDR